MEDERWAKNEKRKPAKVLDLSKNQMDHQVVGEVMEVLPQASFRNRYQNFNIYIHLEEEGFVSLLIRMDMTSGRRWC